MAAPAVSQLDMNGLEILNARFQNLSANPGSPLEGRYYWNTSTKALRIYNGTIWIEIGTGTGTVTSFSAGNLSPLFTTSVATATTTPALTFSLSNAAQNSVFAGPSSGGTGAPSFRALVQADIPNTIPISYWAAATANIAMGTFKITGLGDPTNPQDAATKAYVDQVAQGLDVKGSVRVATTANGTLGTAFANGQTVDGVTLATGDRILIKNQTTQSENGIYTVNASGAPTRAVDFDAWTEIPGAFTFVEVGTTNADSGWVCTSDQGGTLGTTAITFAQFSGAGQITAGAGLTKTGNTIDVAAADSSVTVNADSIQVAVDNSTIEVSSGLRVKDGGITFAKIASAVWGTTIDTTGSVVNVKGYTFVTNFTVARLRVITQTLNNGSNTVTHSLGSQNVNTYVLDASNRYVPVVDIVNTNSNSVTIQNDASSFSATIIIIG